jgi:hypothetical protein
VVAVVVDVAEESNSVLGIIVRLQLKVMMFLAAAVDPPVAMLALVVVADINPQPVTQVLTETTMIIVHGRIKKFTAVEFLNSFFI